MRVKSIFSIAALIIGAAMYWQHGSILNAMNAFTKIEVVYYDANGVHKAQARPGILTQMSGGGTSVKVNLYADFVETLFYDQDGKQIFDAGRNANLVMSNLSPNLVEDDNNIILFYGSSSAIHVHRFDTSDDVTAALDVWNGPMRQRWVNIPRQSHNADDDRQDHVGVFPRGLSLQTISHEGERRVVIRPFGRSSDNSTFIINQAGSGADISATILVYGGEDAAKLHLVPFDADTIGDVDVTKLDLRRLTLAGKVVDFMSEPMDKPDGYKKFFDPSVPWRMTLNQQGHVIALEYQKPDGWMA